MNSGISKRIVLLAILAGLLMTCTGYAQLSISPGTVYKPPADPSCYTITVGGGANVTVDLEYYYEGSGPYYIYGWPTLDGNGQAQACFDEGSAVGLYEFTGVRNTLDSGSSFVGVYGSVYLAPASVLEPFIDGLGSGGDNWDAIWISGGRFQPNSRVYVMSADWSTYQTFWGPAWGISPDMGVSGDGSLITLLVTDPTVRSSFGNGGVYVLVVNPTWNTSQWNWTYSPAPAISSGGSGCDDSYCIWLTGSFPLDARVDFRIPGQSDVLPNAYSDLSVTPTRLTLRLNPSVRNAFDTYGLNAWVVNPPTVNWSGSYYIPPVDRSIIGNIDGIVSSGFQYYITGWSCAKTYAGSVDVWAYVGGPAGTGTWLGAGTANLDSEPELAAACNSTGSHFRFSVPIPYSITQNYGGQPIYIHGISPFGLTSYLLNGSGAFTVPAVDRSVTGWISGVVIENSQYFLRGWACAKTDPGSIDVHLYIGGPSGSGTFVTAVTANLATDGSVAAACNSSGANYGFSILLSLSMRQQFGGQSIYVHGISPFGLSNSLIGNSGSLAIPAPVASSSKEYIYIGDRVLAVDTTNLP